MRDSGRELTLAAHFAGEEPSDECCHGMGGKEQGHPVPQVCGMPCYVMSPSAPNCVQYKTCRLQFAVHR